VGWLVEEDEMRGSLDFGAEAPSLEMTALIEGSKREADPSAALRDENKGGAADDKGCAADDKGCAAVGKGCAAVDKVGPAGDKGAVWRAVMWRKWA
jgi:hypothetical protein